MIWLELALVLGCILVGARLGGIGLGTMAGIGLCVLVFAFGLPPGSPPRTVLGMVLCVVTATATMQAAGGLDWLVTVAERALRARPKAITLLAPAMVYVLVVLGLGTACSTWQTVTDLDQLPMPADSSSIYDVWGKDGHRKLRALRIDADTVRGLPGERPAACDSCPVAIPRAAVDSIRSLKADGAGTWIMGVTIAAMLLPLILIGMMPET